ncbi:glycosyltransferase [Sphaerisporangium sp. NPDC005288]|uniref:glycosyltransferase n=1 Tax=Sphaerisporangium sp. NPDC005288 TaxID=3155114 RepID=UPI0033A682AA
MSGRPARGALRVCEVVKTLDVGGVETLLVERLRRAAGGGTAYTVVCLRASTAELIDRLRDAGVTVVNLGNGPRPLAAARLVTTVRRLAPDVLNVHSPMPAVVLRPFVRLSRRRPMLVSTVHYSRRTGTVFAERVTSAVSTALDRLTRWLDDGTVAVSSQVARSPSTRGARRVLTRLHGVDVEELRHWAARREDTRREFAVPPGAFLIACVANFRPEKDHALLVRAAAEVLRARPDALFLLAGEGPLRDQVARAVERHGVAGGVRILGRVPGARRLAAAADLVVLSSAHEALPVVVMEALAAGVPVVSTEVGGIAELVHTGRNGILTRPGSARDLARGLLRAMDPVVHRRLRDGAWASAHSVDMAGTAEWFEDLYQSLTPATRRG